MDLLKPDELNRGNMQSNKSGLKLKVPLIKYNTFATRSLSYAAATLWNGLPTNIMECKTLDKFKGSLKTYLYRKAFKPAHTHDCLLYVKCMYRCYKLTSPCKVHITKMLQTLISVSSACKNITISKVHLALYKCTNYNYSIGPFSSCTKDIYFMTVIWKIEIQLQKTTNMANKRKY